MLLPLSRLRLRGLPSSVSECSPGSSGTELFDGLSELLKKYDVNDFAASVQVYAVKP